MVKVPNSSDVVERRILVVVDRISPGSTVLVLSEQVEVC